MAIAPGEPVAPPARNAPLRPATLSVEIGPLRPAALSNVKNVVEAPKLTPVTRLPAASNRLTASPPVLSPMPEPL